MKNKIELVPVVAVALVRDDGKVLLQRRPSGKMHGGLWEYPGGKVEKGETPETALIREIEEELGVTLMLADLEPCGFASGGALADSDSRSIVILLYICRRWEGAPRNLDAEAIAWFDFDELSELEMPPLDVPLTKSLIEVKKRLAKVEYPS